MIGLFAVVAQTTILRLPLFHGVFYDLLIPLVVFLRLNLPGKNGILVVLILGLIMDLLSGGVFGLYLSIYFWIFLWIKSVSRYFDVFDTIFQSILIGACVLGQHLVFCISVAAPSKLLAAQKGSVILQLIFAALTGPGILMLLGRLQTRFETRSSGTPQQEIGNSAIRS
jgi:rod shape-determining protein MreD